MRSVSTPFSQISTGLAVTASAVAGVAVGTVFVPGRFSVMVCTRLAGSAFVDVAFCESSIASQVIE